MKSRRTARGRLATAAMVLGAAAWAALLTSLHAADAPKTEEHAMLGGSPERNNVAAEKGLPVTWDLATGKNVKWRADLGGATYAGPVVAGGKIFVGTDNEHPRDPKTTGDQGLLHAF